MKETNQLNHVCYLCSKYQTVIIHTLAMYKPGTMLLKQLSYKYTTTLDIALSYISNTFNIRVCHKEL